MKIRPSLLLALLCCGAAATVFGQKDIEPSSHENPRDAPMGATFLIRSDLECRWSIDGKPQGTLGVKDRVTLQLAIGEHLIEAESSSGGFHWEKVIEVKDAKAQVLTIPLLVAKRQADQYETQAATKNTGYWLDPDTQLMWDAETSTASFGWYEAVKYCRELSVAGHRDWRLPTIEELEQLRDGGAPKGGITSYSYVWSSSQGKNSKEIWVFDFSIGRDSVGDLKNDGGPFFVFSRHALCVRSSR